jgi:hypothetical protein
MAFLLRTLENMPRAIVYTAIFGGYDTLKQPPEQDEACEFICFTDSKMPGRVGAWRVIHVRTDRSVHPRLQAKRFKLLSHRIFPNGRLSHRYGWPSVRRHADLSIWIDASLQIKSSTFVRDMRRKLDDGGWAMFVHPDRNCIYDEASASVIMQKYEGLPILPQVDAYRSIVPPQAGLYACGVIVRREPPTNLLKQANELWWEENLKWTYQDQLSLPFVIRRVPGSEPVEIRNNLWKNQWFDFIPHHADT